MKKWPELVEIRLTSGGHLSGSPFGLSLHFEDNILKGKAGTARSLAPQGRPRRACRSLPSNQRTSTRPRGRSALLVLSWVFIGQKIVRGRSAKLPSRR